MLQILFWGGMAYSLVAIALSVYIAHLEEKERITKSCKRLLITGVFGLPYLFGLLAILLGQDSRGGWIFLFFWTLFIVLSVVGFGVVYLVQKIRGII